MNFWKKVQQGHSRLMGMKIHFYFQNSKQQAHSDEKCDSNNMRFKTPKRKTHFQKCFERFKDSGETV